MELKKHPEHSLYLEQRALARRYRREVALWRQEDGSAADLRALLEAAANLLEAYNRILWQQFPYCGQCVGGCCVVGAADVKAVDYVALALLEKEVPERPERTGLGGRACIYLTPQGCSWPSRWRPLKCALFYCLGSGAIALDASDARYGEITAALAAAIAPRLAHLLPEAVDRLLPLLPDPVAFAGALAAALDEHALAILYEARPQLRPRPTPPTPAAADAEAGAIAFIERATRQLWDDSPPPAPEGDLTAEQLLDDLEMLAWIVEGRPGNADRLLAEMQRRYPPAAAGSSPSLREEMAWQLEQLRAA